jgi:hypothetical protein
MQGSRRRSQQPSSNVADHDTDQLDAAWERATIVPIHGVAVAYFGDVPDKPMPTTERRVRPRTDRRHHSRGGRRRSDPHVNWERLAWLFAVYAIYLSLRSLPSTVVNYFKKERTPTAG